MLSCSGGGGKWFRREACRIQIDAVRLLHSYNIFSQRLCEKYFSKRQFPHISVNLSFIITNIKNKLTDLCGT